MIKGSRNRNIYDFHWSILFLCVCVCVCVIDSDSLVCVCVIDCNSLVGLLLKPFSANSNVCVLSIYKVET